MHGPPLLGWVLAATCALAATVCVSRAMAASCSPAGERQVSALEATMGVGMAAMALPGQPLPRWALLTVFVLVALWAARLLLTRARHLLHHLTEAGAMIYMTLAMAPLAAGAGGHAGHGSGTAPEGWPLVSGALALYFTLYALRAARLLAPVRHAPSAAEASPTAPPLPPRTHEAGRLVDQAETGAACRLILAMAMAAMLIAL